MTPGPSEVFAAFPDAAIDHDNFEHYRGRLERRLLINRCSECDSWHEPPRARCPLCWSDRIVATDVSGNGTIALFTVLHHGPPTAGVDYERGYSVIAVDLVEQPGVRFTATLVDVPDEIRIDTPVELVWIERAGVHLPAFRPRA